MDVGAPAVAFVRLLCVADVLRPLFEIAAEVEVSIADLVLALAVQLGRALHVLLHGASLFQHPSENVLGEFVA